MIIEAAAIASTARLLQPIVGELYQGAKKMGVKGLQRWEARTFASKLARRIRAIEEVRTLWKPEGAISLREFFHPPKLLIDGKPKMVSRVSQLPSKAVVIEGIVGQGKSVLMRSLAVEEILSNDAKCLPLFLELKDLSPKLDLRQAIFKQLESYDVAVDEDSLKYLFESGKISLLLDGFDELEEASIKDTYLSIEHLIRQYPDLQIVISSRMGHEIQKASGFQVLQIAPLVPSEFAAFLDRLKVSSEKSLAVRQAIKNSPSKISDLVTTPLMLTLVLIVYEAESQIPETLPEFFERLFQVVFSRHDHLKGAFTRKHHSGLSERRLQTLFESFCFMTLQLGYSRTLTQAQFHEVFDHALTYTDGCHCESNKFQDDITKVACLMLVDGIDAITFLHMSILEYYAAAFVKRLNDENAQLFYAAAIEKSRGWEQVLTFLKSIDGFRYARDYLVPVVANHRAQLVTRDDADDKTLINQVAKTYPGVGVYFRATGTRVSASAFGSLTPLPGDQIGGFGYLLLDALVKSVPGEIPLDEFQANFPVGDILHPADPHGTLVFAPQIFGRYGAAELRAVLEVFETRLAKLEAEALAVLAGEEKKKLIFAKRLAKTS
jgi:hypothetical protein